MKAKPILVVLLAAMAPLARADCTTHDAAKRPRLVELYTSEGCSSCPPADAWLRRIPHQGDLAALEFHVDYWDSLGWSDRFAESRFSRRQQRQARIDGGSGVFTPQVVLDGRNWPGWYRSSLPTTQADGLASMQLSVDSGRPLHVRLTTTFERPTDATGFENYVAVTEDNLASNVRAGENRGELLRHDHVVRAFAGPLPLVATTDLVLPDDLDAAHAHLVAFSQRPGDGAVAQVLDCALSDSPTPNSQRGPAAPPPGP
jgi:hypothetical protein